MKYKQKKGMMFKHFITGILIYAAFIPIVLLDVIIELYHRIGFELCGIPLVKRSKYIKIDRHKLNYLPWYDKINCAYCGYANGFAKYFEEIATRTETYWCGIKHKKTKNFKDPKYHKKFLEYGNKSEFKKYQNKKK